MAEGHLLELLELGDEEFDDGGFGLKR